MMSLLPVGFGGLIPPSPGATALSVRRDQRRNPANALMRWLLHVGLLARQWRGDELARPAALRHTGGQAGGSGASPQ